MTAGSRVPFRAAILVAALLSAGVAACSDDGSGPDADEILGLWGAVEYEYTSQEDPTRTYDLIDAGGSYSLELVFDGTYRSTLNTLAGTTTGSGTYTVGSGVLTLTPAGGGVPTTYDLSFNDIFLTLVDDDAAWDFDGDAVAEPAELLLVLDRF